MAKLYSKSIKIISLITIFSLLNLVVLFNIEFSAAQSELSNDDLRPDLNDYWEYRRTDYSDNSIYRYNLTYTGETVIKVANIDINVLILEGYGFIEQWPEQLEQSDRNSIYIKKLIRKDNLELIKYTQYIDLEYIREGIIDKRYIHENITYNYIEFNKPNIITIGSNWTKNVIRTQDMNIKRDTDLPVKNVHTDHVNSTFLVDNVYYVLVGNTGYNTLMVLERQWHEDIIDTTIEYYYSDEIHGYVKKIRKDFSGDIVEVEELIAFKSGKEIDNGDQNGKEKNGEESWFDLNDRNVQMLLGAIFILIALVIFGYFGYKRYR
jgi:hypothetical protein